MKDEETKEREAIEVFANLAHKQWSGWMKYLFSKGEKNSNGDFIIDAAFVQRWERQCSTQYDALSEPEKESDRIEAIRVIRTFHEQGGKL